MSSLCRLARQCSQSLSTGSVLSAFDAAATRAPQRQSLQQVRGMGGAAHGPGISHAGVTLHKPSAMHYWAGQALAGLMWAWVFVRFYHDGETFWYGHAAHWEHELAHDAEHAEQGSEGH